MDNGHIESFSNRLLRDECLNQNTFLSLPDAKEPLKRWRRDYNRECPHSALGWMTQEEFRKKNQLCKPIGNANLQVVYSVG